VMNTSDDGVFDAPALTPAAGYRLKISRKGFQDWDSGDFDLAIGQTLDFRVTLKHAEETSGEGEIPAPRIEEAKAGISTLVGVRQIETLPSRDRRLDTLVQLDPLAVVDHRNGRLVLAGQESSNLFIADGVAATNSYFPAKPGVASQLTLDSVQE